MGDSGEVFYEMAKEMVETIEAHNQEGTTTVFICPVGPVGQYPIFVRLVNDRRTSLKNVWFINMDEYLNDDDIRMQPQEVSENLFIIPGSSQLDEDNNNIVLSVEEDADAATHYIDSILKRVEDDYDYILIDSAPGSGAMLVNVIVAADELLVPIADRFSISGAKKLTQIIRANKKSINGHYLLTRQTNYGLYRQIKDLLTAQSPESLYHTSIRQCEDLNKASAYRMSIFDYKPKSKGAEDYMALAKEISGVSKETDMPF